MGSRGIPPTAIEGIHPAPMSVHYAHHRGIMAAAPTIRIGVSGWRYAPWRGNFYPKGLPQHAELEFAARAFPSLEINGSFYSLQRPSSWQTWYEATPAPFVFAVKGPRYLTHMLRLRNAEKPLANFFASGILRLREKLGPILWQFPPNFPYDADQLATFFELLPRDLEEAVVLARKREAFMHGKTALSIDANRSIRYAIEVRHESFRDPSFIRLLRKNSIALVIADTAGRWPMLQDVTADFMYLRLHSRAGQIGLPLGPPVVNRSMRSRPRRGRNPAGARAMSTATSTTRTRSCVRRWMPRC